MACYKTPLSARSHDNNHNNDDDDDDDDNRLLGILRVASSADSRPTRRPHPPSDDICPRTRAALSARSNRPPASTIPSLGHPRTDNSVPHPISAQAIQEGETTAEGVQRPICAHCAGSPLPGSHNGRGGCREGGRLCWGTVERLETATGRRVGPGASISAFIKSNRLTLRSFHHHSRCNCA